jgi:hypothetical protein
MHLENTSLELVELEALPVEELDPEGELEPQAAIANAHPRATSPPDSRRLRPPGVSVVVVVRALPSSSCRIGRRLVTSTRRPITPT